MSFLFWPRWEEDRQEAPFQAAGLLPSKDKLLLLSLKRIQSYRQSINEQRRINYGDGYMLATGIKPPFRPQQPYEGMDSKPGAKNDTHSETRLKGWALATIRQKLQHLPSGSTINIIIFTQVKVCPDCRKDSNGWATQLQQAAPPGVRVNFYTWQQTNFDIDHPDRAPVVSPDEVQLAVSASAP